jgi:cytochrome c oxidase cbb3-type subunit 1
MSAISTTAQTIPVSGDEAVRAASAAEVNASCRPLLLLFLSSTGWLIAGSILGLVSSLTFHKADMFADCACFTYGHTHAASVNSMLYGFGVQAGLAVMLWIAAQTGWTKLALAPVVIGGWMLINLGVTAGVIGLFCGDTTGYEWLEMPRYGSVMFFFGYLLVALAGVVTIHERRERALYISQWFILAALFWFAWIYSSASYLLVARPVRGALQAAVDWWYVNNLKNIFFGFAGIAAIFYFVPKITKRPLHSHYLGVFIFTMLALFGSGGGIPAGVPLPNWLPALSGAYSMLSLVPILGVGFAVWKTFDGDFSRMRENRALKFFVFATISYVIAGLAGAFGSFFSVAEAVNFTWFNPAVTQWFLYGFFAITIFGAAYSIIPKLLGAEFPKPGMICGHFFLAWIGIVLFSVPLMFAGLQQGKILNDASQPFLASTAKTLMAFRIGSTGELLMILGHLVLAVNFGLMLVGVLRTAAAESCASNLKAAEVTK